MKCCDSQEELLELRNRITNLIDRLDNTSFMIFSKDAARMIMEELHEEHWETKPTRSEVG